jgi:S-adenosylmethionine-diacylglycerol 3-amino-3-carboxypropyl transferase
MKIRHYCDYPYDWNGLNFTACNEDSRSELRALLIRPKDVMVCITGSGAHPLDLLTASPKTIISIDPNPVQNYLLELKLAAIRELEYSEYVAFLGIQGQCYRQQVYGKLRSHLTKEAVVYWDKHIATIQRGIIYEGRWERYFRWNSILMRILLGRKLRTWFSIDNLPDQVNFFEKCWYMWAWSWYVRLVLHKAFSKIMCPGPCFYSQDPSVNNVGLYITEGIARSMRRTLMCANHFTHLLTFGRYINPYALPIHLKPDQYNIQKQGLGRIKIITSSLHKALSHFPAQSVDKFSLSDISTYMNEGEYVRILSEVIRVARPNTRICLRHFLVRRDIPKHLSDKFYTEPELEKMLEGEDMCFGHSFTIAKVKEDVLV